MNTNLSTTEKERYSRHLSIPEIGESGQETLKGSSVIVVGTGGLGSASAAYLAAAGVGRLGIADADSVNLSNLQRQVLHGSSTLGMAKVASAQKRLADINAEIQILPFPIHLQAQNAAEVLKDFTVVVDATDNFESRYLLNQVCVQLGKPFVYGAIYQFYGQVSVFSADRGPCFQCVFRKQPSQAYMQANQGLGVVSALPGVIGSIQAVEAIKLLLGIGAPAIGRLLLYDGLDMSFQEIRAEKDPSCPICGTSSSVRN